VLNGLLHILFPNCCLACDKALLGSEKYLCLNCQANLPKTNFHLHQNNIVERTFWGRIPIQRAFSYLYFHEGGMTRKLMHSIKYNGDKELAEYLGNSYGSQLIEQIPEMYFDGILAVPLHVSKFRKRGFNQSEEFAKGLANSTGIPNMSHLTKREIATETQTRKSRLDRWQNVSDIFSISSELKSKKNSPHFLLVDDVITTGATMESFANCLINSLDCKVSIASIAYAI
jgi:ComF family protein